jgi:silicon transporter
MLVNAKKALASPWNLFKEIYSTCLLIFCSIIVISIIFDRNTSIADDSHPVVAFFVLWLAIVWLAYVEGGQASLVGLPPVNSNLYKESHPTTYKIMAVVNKGDNLDRYLMGRQFMVLALVFVENLCADPIDEHRTVLGMPKAINQIFLGTGLAIFFMTAMIGKISAQVNASRCMLDYVNNFFAYFTFNVARAIEASGLLHCCYVVQMVFARLSGQPLETMEAPRTLLQTLVFWLKVIASTVILAFSFVVTLTALFKGQTTMWEGVPSWIAVILFFLFMAVVGMLEGMQIAFFAIANLTEEERAKSFWAKKTCDLLFEGDGRNLPGFMVGRQMCVTMCFFIVARVTTIKLNDGDDNIFGVPDGLQAFFETGLLGALITTIVASITWQLVASAFPMAFLSTPVTYVLLRFCLILEWTGLCQGSWVIARLHKKIVGFKRDEVYIGTAEERAENRMNDPLSDHDEDEDDYDVKPGHLYPGVPALPPNFKKRMHTLEDIEELEKELKEHKGDVETRLKHLEMEKIKLLKGEEGEQATGPLGVSCCT